MLRSFDLCLYIYVVMALMYQAFLVLFSFYLIIHIILSYRFFNFFLFQLLKNFFLILRNIKHMIWTTPISILISCFWNQNTLGSSNLVSRIKWFCLYQVRAKILKIHKKLIKKISNFKFKSNISHNCDIKVRQFYLCDNFKTKKINVYSPQSK